MSNEPAWGKCKSCGFLAKRTLGGYGKPPPEDYEATIPERTDTLYFFKRWNESGALISVDFACFRDVVDLSESYRLIPDETAKHTAGCRHVGLRTQLP